MLFPVPCNNKRNSTELKHCITQTNVGKRTYRHEILPCYHVTAQPLNVLIGELSELPASHNLGVDAPEAFVSHTISLK